MSRELHVSFESGVNHRFRVKEAEFHVYPLTIPEGEEGEGQPHPKAGQLSSYKIETLPEEKIDIIWFKLDRVESIVLTTDSEDVSTE